VPVGDRGCRDARLRRTRPAEHGPWAAPEKGPPVAVNTSPGVEIDGDALMSFVFRAVDEVGAALNAALVVMGDQLGYYRALADHGPLAAPDLARLTATDEHYAREWLNAQAAGSYLDRKSTRLNSSHVSISYAVFC